MNSDLRRSKSLSRPERQRRRTAMIQSQEMPSHLQSQLDHKRQYETLQEEPQEEKEKEPKVLTSAWAWISYLLTCCIPSIVLRTCFGKSNKNMQQAWREKVYIKKSLYIKHIKIFIYNIGYSVLPYCIFMWLVSVCNLWSSCRYLS